jgi:hypothetical protein
MERSIPGSDEDVSRFWSRIALIGATAAIAYIAINQYITYNQSVDPQDSSRIERNELYVKTKVE